MVRLELQRALEGALRPRQVAVFALRGGELPMKADDIASRRDRLLEQLDRARVPAGAIGELAEEEKRVHVAGLLAQDPAVPVLGLAELARVVQHVGFTHPCGDSILRGGLLPRRTIPGVRAENAFQPAAHHSFLLPAKLSYIRYHRRPLMKSSTGENLNGLIRRGNELEDGGDVAAALRCYQQAIEISPDTSGGYLNAGNALLALGRTADAIASYRRAADLDPASPKGFLNLGVACLRQRDFAAAAHAYRRALEVDQARAEAWVGLGCALEEEHPEEASAAYRDALAREPGHAGAAVNLSACLRRL